tara:strand:+ start:24835 stop:25878 length:1044 start_codon:yes stop_codon:yes gene_type:complete
MHYFSVQNNYHIQIAKLFIKKFKIPKNEIYYILNSSPHYYNLDVIDNKIFLKAHPLSSGGGYKKINLYFKCINHNNKIKKAINFCDKDKLFILSEYEINNSILAKQIKIKNGKNYLIAESIGFYFNHHKYYQSNKEQSIYLKILNLIFFIFNLPIVAKKGQEGIMYLSIKNRLIDKIYSRFDFEIERNLPIEKYKCISDDIMLNTKNKNIIVFASNFECFGYQKEEINLIKKAITICSKKFDKVSIKVHPQDYILKNNVYKEYQQLNLTNVKIVENSLTPLEAIKKHNCSYACGSISTSLFDALNYGCKTFFLFHLLKEIEELKVSKTMLDSIGYKFIDNLNDIDID